MKENHVFTKKEWIEHKCLNKEHWLNDEKFYEQYFEEFSIYDKNIKCKTLNR